MPTFALSGIGWTEIAVGSLFLALPQVPLMIGNATIAITEKNNRLFRIAWALRNRCRSLQGILNLFGTSVGVIPMCHGAGSMVGHVHFGARTGGVTITLGRS